MQPLRYHIAYFFSRLSHYALVELVVENEVAQNFLGKNDCASVQNICALKGFASCPPVIRLMSPVSGFSSPVSVGLHVV